jgi:hypothetical protein
MIDANNPKDKNSLVPTENISDQAPSVAQATREEAKELLSVPQLPSEFVERIKTADMTDADGRDLKKSALQLCDNINVLFRQISKIPELTETTRAINAKLESLTGAPLYEQIRCILEELNQMTRIVTEKVMDSEKGPDYLQNVGDGSGTPRVDLEAALNVMERTRGVARKINQLDLGNQGPAIDHDSVQKRRTADKSEYVSRYEMQRTLEGLIDQALEHGEINEETARLILKATSAQMELSSNAVAGQINIILKNRFDEDDLGTSPAERQFTILLFYWQLLGTVEGFRYLERFYAKK